MNPGRRKISPRLLFVTVSSQLAMIFANLILLPHKSMAPSDCPRLRFNVLSIDYVRVTNRFYDYDYISNPIHFVLP